jgi:hypothetical protein
VLLSVVGSRRIAPTLAFLRVVSCLLVLIAPTGAAAQGPQKPDASKSKHSLTSSNPADQAHWAYEAQKKRLYSRMPGVQHLVLKGRKNTFGDEAVRAAALDALIQLGGRLPSYEVPALLMSPHYRQETLILMARKPVEITTGKPVQNEWDWLSLLEKPTQKESWLIFANAATDARDPRFVESLLRELAQRFTLEITREKLGYGWGCGASSRKQVYPRKPLPGFPPRVYYTFTSTSPEIGPEGAVLFSKGPHNVWYTRHERHVPADTSVATYRCAPLYTEDYLAALAKVDVDKVRTLVRDRRSHVPAEDGKPSEGAAKWRREVENARAILISSLQAVGFNDLNFVFPPLEFKVVDRRTQKTSR